MAEATDGAEAKVRLRYMATEPGAPDKSKLLEGWEYMTREALLAGPVSRRVAIIDIDPETGAVLPGAAFLPPTAKRKLGRYMIKNEGNPNATDFQQVSVFGAIMKTMHMFEESDVLGRPLRWAFDGEQLLVVPRAGRMTNAFYHRDSRSLQFFFFTAANAKDTVYTCLSPDIVAHETTHAILDGIAPDLYDAVSPQSLALHEAIADLSAVIFALRTRTLRLDVLERSKGDLNRFDAFNEIARQFGEAAYGADRPLRNLFNEDSFGSWGTPPASNDPHDLSTVLSGALYRLLIKEFEEAKTRIVKGGAAADGAEDDEENDGGAAPGGKALTPFEASGKALANAGQKFKRIIFRGLDYLPPGEISFADYGRAVIAADQSTNPNDHSARDVIKAEFERRAIVTKTSELDPIPPDLALPADLDLDLLVRSDWAAYQFAETRRTGLMIPADIPFEVRPRLDVTKTTYRSEGRAGKRECIIKVAWREDEVIEHAGGFFDKLSITYGTTLAIDWETKAISALLSTSRLHASQKSAATSVNSAMRKEFLAKCLAEGVLEIGAPNVQIHERRLRLRAMGQMLHMAGH